MAKRTITKRKTTKRTSGKRVTQGSLLTSNERSKIKSIGEPIALLLGRIGFSPDALTLVGFGIVLIATAQVALGNWALAAGILIAGTLFDGLDGTLARATNRVTAFGAFFDSSLDRAAEAVIYAGIVYSAAVLGDIQIGTAAALALGIGSLVSYVRAWAKDSASPHMVALHSAPSGRFFSFSACSPPASQRRRATCSMHSSSSLHSQPLPCCSESCLFAPR